MPVGRPRNLRRNKVLDAPKAHSCWHYVHRRMAQESQDVGSVGGFSKLFSVYGIKDCYQCLRLCSELNTLSQTSLSASTIRVTLCVFACPASIVAAVTPIPSVHIARSSSLFTYEFLRVYHPAYVWMRILRKDGISFSTIESMRDTPQEFPIVDARQSVPKTPPPLQPK